MSLDGLPTLSIISILCTYLISAVCCASTAQHYFQKSTACGGVEGTYYQSVTSGPLDCAFVCAGRSNCTAYQRVNGSFCLLYSWVVQVVVNCTAANSVDVYLKRSSSCQNGATASSDGTSCQCVNGYVGPQCESVMEDCSDGYKNGGYRVDQKYWIKPILAPAAFQVRCQMSQGTGLTLIQRRTNENVDFNKTWQDYKSGFEINENEDYWLGNDYIHWITSSYSQIMMIQLSSGSGKSYQYYYNGFKMDNETESYSVTYMYGWNSNNTDKKSMAACWPGTSIHFSTWDKDNDGNDSNCARIYGAGFWYTRDNCTLCNPNGRLSPGENERLNVPSENFWTPNLGNWMPDMVVMLLFRK